MRMFGKSMMIENFSQTDAAQLDAADPLAHFRNQFHIPRRNGSDLVYLCGNSLGLQPRSASGFIGTELTDWAELGVEGHVHAKKPWVSYHEQFAKPLSSITGSLEHEVVAMNSLTVNLHLLLVSFYRPTPQRFRIICEEKAFPSDLYALQSQAKLHGLKPEDVIRIVPVRDGNHAIDQNDLLDAIQEEGESLALVMLGGVNYYTGQLFDMKRITEATHRQGAIAGFDLAHAIGNVELQLHNWNVDFAAWCSYKYLNSGPGGVGGVYIHERHVKDQNRFKLTGWWGTEKETRFEMAPVFNPIETVESWQLSNAPIVSMAVHKAALNLFEEAGFQNLLVKSRKLSGYAAFLLEQLSNQPGFNAAFSIITPQERGAQLSLLFNRDGRLIFDYLTANGIIVDWREPNVIRIAPVPLYSSFSDVKRFADVLAQAVLNHGR
jgi:kynureninase